MNSIIEILPHFLALSKFIQFLYEKAISKAEEVVAKNRYELGRSHAVESTSQASDMSQAQPTVQNSAENQASPEYPVH
jgi:hypothetical protein